MIRQAKKMSNPLIDTLNIIKSHTMCLSKSIGATRIHLLFGFMLFVVVPSLQVDAQEQWEKEGEGEIKDVEIEIIKDRQITLPRANRNFEKVPPRPFETIQPAITYEFKNFRFVTPEYNPLIRPLKLKQEDLTRIYGNYLSAGVGNYASFFLEGSLTTKRDKNKFLGAHVVTRNFGKGPVDEKNSGSSNTLVQVFGKSTGKSITLSGDANYENRGTYFYGYNPVAEVNRDIIRQTYGILGINGGIQNTKTGDFSYSLKGGYSYLSDHYRATEGETSVAFNSTFKLTEKSNFILNADYFLINRKDSLISSTVRHLFRVRPYYQFSPVEKLLVTGGVNLALQNDQYDGSKDFHAYPHVKAQYTASPSMEFYGVVTGDIDKVNLHTLASENLWINSNIPIYHTNRALEFQAGLKGKIGRRVAVGAGVSIASLKNYYYYLNVRENFYSSGNLIGAVDKFNIVYDKNTQRINPFAEISYAHGEAFTLGVRGDYYDYDTDVLLDAWHRPTYRVGINSRYNLFEKISIDASFIAQGGMKAFDPTSNEVVTLKEALDLNLKGRYFFSKQFSAFLQFNNMLSNNYPLFLSYPVRGFQVMGGVSWSF